MWGLLMDDITGPKGMSVKGSKMVMATQINFFFLHLIGYRIDAARPAPSPRSGHQGAFSQDEYYRSMPVHRWDWQRIRSLGDGSIIRLVPILDESNIGVGGNG